MVFLSGMPPHKSHQLFLPAFVLGSLAQKFREEQNLSVACVEQCWLRRLQREHGVFTVTDLFVALSLRAASLLFRT